MDGLTGGATNKSFIYTTTSLHSQLVRRGVLDLQVEEKSVMALAGSTSSDLTT